MSVFKYSAESSDEVRKKIKFFVIIAIISFICLWMRVWYLQILRGEDFIGLSENNRARQISLPGYRGIIKDRNGEILVGIRPSFNLYVTPEDAQNFSDTLKLLSEKIAFDQAKLEKSVGEARSFMDVLIKRDITREEVAFIEENKMRLPGIHINVEPLRSYVQKGVASHVLGYLGEISKAKLERIQDSSYQQGDMIGKNGLESIFESELRGAKGYKEVEVDVSGRELRVLRKLPPDSGKGLILTLDVRIQKVAEELMKGTDEEPVSGSVIMMKVQTREIIVLTSKPSFDANLFAARISKEDWRGLVRHKLHPLQNRAIDGQYPPGSTYKMITALAGLEENVITPETTIYCPGNFRLGKGFYRCWKKKGHGAIALHDAIVQSCDVFFYTVGHRLGIDRLARYAKMFGLGGFTGIGLKGEKSGLVPTSQWKLRTRKEKWLEGETIIASIGQGYNLVTPLQQARMMAALANGGTLLRPYLVKAIENQDGKIINEFFPEIVKRAEINPQNLEFIRKGMRGVVNEPQGTGRRARLKSVTVSGKTGTAQVVRMKPGEEEQDEEGIPYQFRDHAWFLSFAPYENPEIAIIVLVEHGGHGGRVAAPIAKKLAKVYFDYYPPPKGQSASVEPLNQMAYQPG